MLSVVEAVNNLESLDIIVTNDNVGNRETAESVKRLLWKHEDLSSEPQEQGDYTEWCDTHLC